MEHLNRSVYKESGSIDQIKDTKLAKMIVAVTGNTFTTKPSMYPCSTNPYKLH